MPTITKTSTHIEEAMDYIYHSEMGGQEDETDPWYPTWASLNELLEKVLEEETNHTPNEKH
tara:strand:- start:560 stop:742 length:183 start_codon:yes stop_codon:yes gene_type:complete